MGMAQFMNEQLRVVYTLTSGFFLMSYWTLGKLKVTRTTNKRVIYNFAHGSSTIQKFVVDVKLPN